MPLYEYECDACGNRFEQIQRYSDPPTETCIRCGAGPVRKLLSSPAIQFKGSGWYITDYARKGGSDSGKAVAKSSEASESKAAESKDGDAKTGESKTTDTKSTPSSKE